MLCDLSSKQKYALTNSDARLNIWSGAVRSGKSYSADLRFIEFMMSDIEGDMIIVGKSQASIKRNVISELERLVGSDLRYYSGNGELKLWGRTTHVIGANDDRAEGKIRGMTLAGGLVDEATIIPENFFKMLLSRLSIPGAKLFVTTNPDSPFHWLKTQFIDRQAELDMNVFDFDLEDNPSLTEEYKNALRREYQGLWYERFIKGRWVQAEGAIYDFFDKELHTLLAPPGVAEYHLIGVDYGTTNPCSFQDIAVSRSHYPNIWAEREYYWNSKKELRQKPDSEYAQDLKEFIQGLPVKAILIDPSAASFIAECRRIGISNIVEADNDVLTGIRYVSTLLHEGTLKVCRNCINLIKEIQTYVWDEKASLRGEDKPKKENDHALDAVRYACMYLFHSGIAQVTAEELTQRYMLVNGIRAELPKVFTLPGIVGGY